MRKFIKITVPLLLALAILVSIGWYLLIYDTGFTRDLLLRQARNLEAAGNHSAAIWFYELAYQQAGQDDQVAIALAQQFKDIGNYTKAEYTLSTAIQDGGSTELYMALCQTYIEQNKLLDAVKLLDKISNPEIKAELDALRPAAPVASHPSGFYSQYLSVELQAADGTVYCSTLEEYPSLEKDACSAPVVLSGGQTTIWAYAVGENGLVSLPAVFHYTVDQVIEEVTFQDPAVEAAVRQQLGFANDHTVYSNELWDMTEFTMPAGAISCADLRWLTGLKQLTMENLAMGSIEVLQNLSQLESLTIRNCVISSRDLPAVAALPRLQSLTLSGCGLSSIEGLEQAQNLVYLDLGNNTIRNTAPLAALGNLQELYLGHNALISLEHISALTNLQVLDVSYNSILSSAPLSALTKLTRLDISSNGLMVLEGVEGMTQLREFSGAYNYFIDVNGLAASTLLEYLDISNNNLLNIDVAAKFTKLKSLNFSHNEVASLPAFSSGCPMTVINGSYNQITSLQPLTKLSSLEMIYMDYNQNLRSVNLLSACKKLKILNVYGTKVTNVDTLAAMGVIVNYKPT